MVKQVEEKISPDDVKRVSLGDLSVREYQEKHGKLTPDGSEVLSSRPLVIPFDCRKPMTLQEQMARCYRDPGYLRYLQSKFYLGDENEEDFGEEEEDLEVHTPYETPDPTYPALPPDIQTPSGVNEPEGGAEGPTQPTVAPPSAGGTPENL